MAPIARAALAALALLGLAALVAIPIVPGPGSVAFAGIISFRKAANARPTAPSAISGTLKQWHTVTVDFDGPAASERDDAPNPFLDYRLQVTFRGPAGQTYVVPGFFGGDGAGNGKGRVWRVRFTPDAAGGWTYQASFRAGPRVAIELQPAIGAPAYFDGVSGSFHVASRDPDASGFLKWGRLEYVGAHYLKFRDGPYWIKGGTDSPENLLAYVGFANTPMARLSFTAHIADWQSGDPQFNAGGPDQGKGLIGALNYLGQQGVNSIYFLPMNIGGDGQDTAPFVAPLDWRGSTGNDNLHYDIRKLSQWEVFFTHAQQKGIHLHVVLGEAETSNKRELDDGELGIERKLFYREMVARFGHHLALQWNVSEEYDEGDGYGLGSERVKAFADYITRLDPYHHAITVHNVAHPDVAWAPFVGDPRFSVTSFQYYRSTAESGAEVEKWRHRTAAAGRPLVISLDEPRTVTTENMAAQRKEILWPTYLSGGQLEWYVEAEDQSLDNFRRYEPLWAYTRYARRFLEEHLPFWQMVPQDHLLTGLPAGAPNGQVFANPGNAYAIYLPRHYPDASLDLQNETGTFYQRWYNPRDGRFYGDVKQVTAGITALLGTPPGDATEDWAILLIRSEAITPAPTPPARAAQAGVVSAPMISPARVGGLIGQYYASDHLTQPVMTRIDSVINFDWGEGSPHEAVPADSFFVRWTGAVRGNTAEAYTFYVTSNDGARLWIGGQLLIDEWMQRSATESAGTIYLEAGQWHPIVLEYFEAGGTASVNLAYASPPMAKQIVPTTNLRPFENP